MHLRGQAVPVYAGCGGGTGADLRVAVNILCCDVGLTGAVVVTRWCSIVILVKQWPFMVKEWNTLVKQWQYVL